MKKPFFQKPNRKVVVDFVASVVVFAAAVLGFELDPTQAAVVAKVVGSVLAYLVPETH